MELEIKDLSLNYFGHSDSLHSITYSFKKGLNVVFGVEGSGKTSLLKGIAGVNAYHSGSVLLDGNPLASGRECDISFVFDDLGFFPRRSLLYNLSYPFRIRKISKKEYLPIIERWLDEFQIPAHLLDSKVFRLQDNFKVRASLIRGFYRNSKVIILDNPLASLNTYERVKEFLFLAKFLKQTDSIVIYATDSIDEMKLLDSPTLVLSYGYLSETGLASNLLEKPQCLSTLELLVPYFNKFEITLEEKGFSWFGRFFELDYKNSLAESFVNKTVIIGFKPEAVIDGVIQAVSPFSLNTAKEQVHLLKIENSEIYSNKRLTKIGLDVEKIMLFDPHTERIIFGNKEKENEEED